MNPLDEEKKVEEISEIQEPQEPREPQLNRKIRERLPELRPDRNRFLEGLSGVVLGTLMSYAMLMLAIFSASSGASITTIVTMAAIFLVLILTTWGIVKLFKKGYPEIAIALLVFYLVPTVGFTLLFGSCLLMLTPM